MAAWAKQNQIIQKRNAPKGLGILIDKFTIKVSIFVNL